MIFLLYLVKYRQDMESYRILQLILSLHALNSILRVLVNLNFFKYAFKYRLLLYGVWITSIVEFNSKRSFVFKQRYRICNIVVVFSKINILTRIISIFSRELHTQMKTNHNKIKWNNIFITAYLWRDLMFNLLMQNKRNAKFFRPWIREMQNFIASIALH